MAQEIIVRERLKSLKAFAAIMYNTVTKTYRVLKIVPITKTDRDAKKTASEAMVAFLNKRMKKPNIWCGEVKEVTVSIDERKDWE